MEEHIINEINEILKHKTEFLYPNFLKIREQYNNPYHYPELDTLRHEICMCILFGLNQAAITLTNHLLEAFLKFSLINFEFAEKMKGTENTEIDVETSLDSFKDDIKEINEKYNSQDLSQNINRANSIGLITKDQKKILHDFRDKFRNSFSHADRKKFYGDMKVTAQAVTIKDGKLLVGSEQDSKIFDLPFTHSIAQFQISEQIAHEYFNYLDKIIRDVIPKLIDKK